MVLDQVVPGRMVAVRPATLFVDERVRDGVGSDVRHVAQAERQELLVPFLPGVGAVTQQFGLVHQRLADRRGAPVVGHVAPQEVLLRVALRDHRVHGAPQVGERGQLLHAHGFDRVEQFLHGGAELGQDAAGQVVEQFRGGVDQRADGLVPHRDEVAPDLLDLDQEPDDPGHGGIDLVEDGQHRFPVVLAGRVEEVVHGQRQHDVVGERAEDVVAPVLGEEEQIGADRPDGGEFLPLAHQVAAGDGVVPGGGLAERRPVGEAALGKQVGDPACGVDMCEVTRHRLPSNGSGDDSGDLSERRTSSAGCGRCCRSGRWSARPGWTA